MFSIIFFIIFGLKLNAFVPDALSIFKKYADTQTNQSINATFLLTDPTSSLSWKEIWQTEANGLRVVGLYQPAPGTKEVALYNFLYTADKKLSAVSNSTSSLGEEFVESLFFHGGDTAHLRKFVLRLRFLPSSSLQPIVISNIKTYTPSQDPFIKVSRSNGLVTLALSQSSDLSEGNILWIDQDQYLPRKIKLSTGAVIVIDSYSTRVKNFTLPAVRTYEWEQKKIESTLQSVLVYKESKLSLKEISAEPSPSVIYEFMKKFR